MPISHFSEPSDDINFVLSGSLNCSKLNGRATPQAATKKGASDFPVDSRGEKPHPDKSRVEL